MHTQSAQQSVRPRRTRQGFISCGLVSPPLCRKGGRAEESEISFSDFAADAIAAGEDPGKKRGTVSFKTFDTAIKALQLGRAEEDE